MCPNVLYSLQKEIQGTGTARVRPATSCMRSLRSSTNPFAPAVLQAELLGINTKRKNRYDPHNKPAPAAAYTHLLASQSSTPMQHTSLHVRSSFSNCLPPYSLTSTCCCPQEAPDHQHASSLATGDAYAMLAFDRLGTVTGPALVSMGRPLKVAVLLASVFSRGCTPSQIFFCRCRWPRCGGMRADSVKRGILRVAPWPTKAP